MSGIAEMSIKQLKEKVMEVVAPGKDRDDFMTIIKWIEDLLESYKQGEKEHFKNSRRNQEYIRKKNEECNKLDYQVEELEAEIEGLSTRLELYE